MTEETKTNKETSKMWDYKKNKDDKLGKQIEKKGVEITYTNPEMAKYLISLIKFEDNDIVCDPCRATGAFYNNFPENVKKVWYEIYDGKDYLTSEDEIVDYTLSNPPFVPRKLFWEFQLKAMRTTKKKIYWLINLSSMNVFTPRRLRIMKEQNWFITSQHIVADKRWYGRYVWLELSKNNNNYYTWYDGKSF